MIYNTQTEIFNSIIYSLFFGGIAFFTGEALYVIIVRFFDMICMPIVSYRAASRISRVIDIFRSTPKYPYCANPAVLHVYDFLFVWFFGFFFSLLAYIACDGVLRLYVFILALISFYFCKKIFGSSFRNIMFKFTFPFFAYYSCI